jgi:hypothetical protein
MAWQEDGATSRWCKRKNRSASSGDGVDCTGNVKDGLHDRCAASGLEDRLESAKDCRRRGEAE